jgi:hypothetical protein
MLSTEVRGIFGKITQLGASRLNRFAYSGNPVDQRAVHRHAVTAIEFRNVVEVGYKDRSVHGPIKHQRHDHHALRCAGRQLRCDLPMAIGNGRLIAVHADRGRETTFKKLILCRPKEVSHCAASPDSTWPTICSKIPRRYEAPSTVLEPIPKVVESDESFVIRYAAPNRRLGVPRCGNLNIAALLSGVVCDIRVT